MQLSSYPSRLEDCQTKFLPHRQQMHLYMRQSRSFLPSQAHSKDPVELLDKVVSKGRREECILRNFDAMDTSEWAFHVPRCFNDALDIRLISRKWNCVEYTAWTQGANFSFKAGDILYRNLSSRPCSAASFLQ